MFEDHRYIEENIDDDDDDIMAEFMCVLKAHPHQHNETMLMKKPDIFLIRYLEKMMLPKKFPQPSIVLDKNNETYSGPVC